MTNKQSDEQWVEEVDELKFIACPTEEEPPFFWRWTKEGKEVLAVALARAYERGRKLTEEEQRKANSGRKLYQDGFRDGKITGAEEVVGLLISQQGKMNRYNYGPTEALKVLAKYKEEAK